ncbi:MAG: hypothetical protein WBG01_16630 [Bacteroidota bacterium]
MKLRLLLLLLATPSLLLGQQVTVQSLVAPVDALTINDVDFLNATTPKWLFTINLTVVPGGQSLDVTMSITLAAVLASGEAFPRAAYVETNRFTVNSTRTITNLDLQEPGFVAISETDPAAKSKFEEVALPSGIMPPGAYNFRVEVKPVPSGETTGDEFRIVLANPSSIELLVPVNGDVVATQFPLFQWMFDGLRSSISIFEKLPGQTSFEETASGVPHLSTEVTANYFQYPAAGVRVLQPGHAYVWFVEGHVQRTGGTDLLIKSPLRSFTVGVGAGTASVPEVTLLDDLERALGPKYKPLFDEIRAEGFAPSGTARVDGQPVSVVDLLQIINTFRENPANVLSVRVE